MKRLFDFSLAFVGLILSLPLWLIFAFLIRLEDKGPIFYVQDRVGKNGKIFKSFKFRSMIYHKDINTYFVQAEEDDARVTKIGVFLRATAMDELPQLINILKGDMSFVGPRALVDVEKEVSDNVYRSVFEIPGFVERSSIRPGLTGIAQILASRDIDRENKFKYDIWYIKNRNLFMDIRIIAVSFLVTLLGRWEIRRDKIKLLSYLVTTKKIL